LTKANALGYRELSSGESCGADGGVWPSSPGQGGFVQLFVEVPDVEDCIARAAKLGAKVIVPKSVLPDGDTMAVLLDPTGLSFGVCQLKKRD
jgi:predicted enzyme related to lactoylglutathione lyase